MVKSIGRRRLFKTQRQTVLKQQQTSHISLTMTKQLSRRRGAALLIIFLIVIVALLFYVSLPFVSRLVQESSLHIRADTKETNLPDEFGFIPDTPFIQHPVDLCHVVGRNPQASKLWQFNSRALCLSSSICFPSAEPWKAYLHSADLTKTKCVVDTPDFTQLSADQQDFRNFNSCSEAQKQLVLCAHGDGLIRDSPECPDIMPSTSIDLKDPSQVRWFEDLTVVVPSYPYPGNIYHFGNVVSWVAHVIDALPALIEGWGSGNVHAAGGKTAYFTQPRTGAQKINIIFRGPQNANGWQVSLLDLIGNNRIGRDGRDVVLEYLRPRAGPKYTCVRNAVVLGRRGHVNVWPFPNSTAVPLDGLSVPADAVDFKRAVYQGLDIRARLPERKCEQNCVSELPPLTLGYARRLSAASAIGGNVHATGTIRRFNEADDEWFTAMLRNETDATGVRLHVFTTSSEETLQEQVVNIVQVGFVVGIHGANLVNAMFMHPFGALLEIFPGGARSPCYIAGSNSGLAYLSHESSEIATPEESGCAPDNNICQNKYRQRLVKLGRPEDRRRVRSLVRKGLKHLLVLHQSYSNGVPVKYDPHSAYFAVVDS